MRNLLGLSWRLMRGGGLLGTFLTLSAVAVSTALLLLAIAANLAFDRRAEREAWRQPVAAAPAAAVAIQAGRPDVVYGEKITVVDLAALKPGAPAPPGLPRFPRAGEVWMSPALARLADRLPEDQLADRFPGRRAGVIAADALIFPDEMVAVIGRDAESPAMAAGITGPGITGPGISGPGISGPPTKIADFSGGQSHDAYQYGVLVKIATVLVLVSLLVFGGAAARLTVARRDRRLAALRLVGATPGQVVAMTTAEAVVTAVFGALAGMVVYGLSLPLISRIPMQGGPWFTSDLWAGLPPVLGVLLAVPLLVGISAVAGLRRIVVSPLGVAKRETPPGMKAVRVLALIAALALVPLVSRDTALTVILIVLGAAFLAINLAGPWVVSVIGRITAATARSPARLLAGRRLTDDPRAAWRTVAGVALTGFVAGFVGLLSPDATALGGRGSPDRISVTVPESSAGAALARARRLLPEAKITTASSPATTTIVAKVGGGAAEVERAKTALTRLTPGRTPTTGTDLGVLGGIGLMADIQTGTRVVLVASFLIAITSAAITSASSILDRRQTYALLRLAGTPLEVLNAARARETYLPLLVMGGGSVAAGLFSALPFAAGAINGSGAIILAVCVVTGFTGVVLAGTLTRPLLRSVTADPEPRPD